MAASKTTDLDVLHDSEKLSLSDSSPAPQEVRHITGFKWFIFLVSTLTAIFVYALDNTIVANIAPKIVNQFHAVEDLPWLSVGFVIGGMAMILPFGKLYALFDAKWVFIVCTVMFMAGSALCGGAPTMNAEIVGRVIAGEGKAVKSTIMGSQAGAKSLGYQPTFSNLV